MGQIIIPLSTLPLKQGLKQEVDVRSVSSEPEPLSTLPLKQGLKRHLPEAASDPNIGLSQHFH